MLRLVARTAQGALLCLAAYNAATSLAGWKNRVPAPPGGRSRRFRVVVPAHDEGHVIAALLQDLVKQDYPAEMIDVWVLADRCTDDTGAVSAGLAKVAERKDGPDGKGAALGWYMSTHPLDSDEALVILDADNRVPPTLIGRFADELDAGHHVLQAYLDVTNPDAGAIATASALSYWAGNRMVQLARSNLGWSADLGGTGMCMTAAALDAAGGFGESMTEDQELGVRLALAGFAVQWVHDVKVFDEKPTGVQAAVTQRARWAAGKHDVARSHGAALVRKGMETRDWAFMDQALRLVQPGRSFVAMAIGALGGLSWLTSWRWLVSARVLFAAAIAQVVLPIPFLARDGVDKKYLVRYPLLTIFGALWGPVQVVARRMSGGWAHTTHVGDQR